MGGRGTACRQPDSEAVIAALEGHRYRLLKDEQYWRDFDHQNVQSIYAVRVRNRSEIMQDRFKQDYFTIIHRMDGEEAAPSRMTGNKNAAISYSCSEIPHWSTRSSASAS